MIEARDTAPIDMSLRLWSDTVELDPVLRKLGFEPNVVHSPGMPMATEGPLARRMAKRHYASTARSRGQSNADIERWLSLSCGRIEKNERLADFMRSGRIEAVLWIALLGRRQLPTPRIAQALVSRSSDLGVVILIENYTRLEHGNPIKLWLPAQPSARLVSA